MGEAVDLLSNYPKAPRNLEERDQGKSEEVRAIARQFGKEYFDGSRDTGYGGFSYHPRFWEPVIPQFVDHFGITAQSSVLDVGCAKGFMLHDFQRLVPGLTVSGVDISDYAIEHAVKDVQPYLQVANAASLPFEDDSFDFVFSINTVHNLDREECAQALREIERVARLGSFVTLDAYRDDVEKKRMYQWNLTGLTIMSATEWETFFEAIGYTGDYYWFIP